MKILITGSEGYIARHLMKALFRRGILPVLKLDIKTGEDIRDDLKKYEIFNPDIIFHLAGQSSVKNSFSAPKVNFSNNVLGTINLLKLGGKMIFASTGTVYGNRLDAKETDRLEPQSPYAMSKLIAEQHIIYSGLPYVVLRIGNVYGKDNHRGVIKALKEGGEIFGDGFNLRDYIYINDVVDALWRSIKWKNGIYNIGTGIDTSVNEIADLLKVKKKYGKAVREQKFVSFNIGKARKAGWRPRYKLKDYILK